MAAFSCSPVCCNTSEFNSITNFLINDEDGIYKFVHTIFGSYSDFSFDFQYSMPRPGKLKWIQKFPCIFFWDIEKAYLNKNLNKNFSKICKGYQVILSSAYPGRIRNIAVFLSDFIKFSRNISISLDVALVNGDFLFNGGLFNPSFATLDDELMCFSMLFFLN